MIWCMTLHYWMINVQICQYLYLYWKCFVVLLSVLGEGWTGVTFLLNTDI